MPSNFTTQASNFISALSGEVDPRTGMYGYNISVAQLHGNAALGPELPITLSYSPLSEKNNSYGIGVSLPVSTYTVDTRTLQLSTGEQYKVVVSGKTMKVIHAKPINFKVEIKDGGYYIHYKNGITEILTDPNKKNNYNVTETICTPANRKIFLKWENFGGSKRLISVQDESATLLTVTYSSTGSKITFQVWPGSSEEYSTVLTLQNDKLTKVVSNLLEWSFEYSISGLLSRVQSPTGLVDIVNYSNTTTGHRFPTGGPTQRLPYVTRYRQTGNGKTFADISYAFSTNNFLGYGGSNVWSADSDYLYGVLSNYKYTSTETVKDETDADRIITTREYSNYHLLNEESIKRGSCTQTISTLYHAIKGTNFDGQPSNFQLPKQQTITFTDTSLPAESHSRSEVTLTEYDNFGNPTKQTDPDGTTTITEYYPAEGDGENCPEEPNGFVHFMKRQTITPPANAYHDTPPSITEYTYRFLGDSDCVVQNTRLELQGEKRLRLTTTEYDSDTTSTEFGRITSIINTLYDGSLEYTSRQDFTTAVKDDEMTQTVTFTGHDNISTITIRKQSTLSGLLLSETNTQGVTVNYTYDLLGRPVTRTIASGTPYENIQSWEYSIEESGPVTIEKDTSGNQIRHLFDAQGREVTLYDFDSDNVNKFFDVADQSFNMLDEKVAISGRDWKTTTSEDYSVETSVEYDDWGMEALMTYSDNTSDVIHNDLVSLTTTRFSQGGKLQNNKITTVLDPFSQLPVLRTRYDAVDKEQGVHSYKYDGLDRLREEQDERGNITKYSWDAWGRELTRTLPDSTVMEREYAQHLTGDYPTLITVTGPDRDGKQQRWTLGSREYDSLGRLTVETVGGRHTNWLYDGASPLPSTEHLPDGRTITYSYIPELGNVISVLNTDSVTQTFHYNPLTGDLLNAAEGDMADTQSWTASGNMIEQQFIRGDTTHQASHEWTLAGQPLAYTDVTGKRTERERNMFGLITRIVDDAITTEFEYDSLQRLKTQIVKDNNSSSTLTTTLGYDDFNREISRTLVDSSGTTLVVTQTWFKNDQMESRATTQDGAHVRQENYEYDNRNRLINYTVSGSDLPVDGYGQLITAQNYNYDALDNLITVITRQADGQKNTAMYFYNNPDDPTQLSKVTHTDSRYPANIELEYDACGRMTKDEAGRVLTYDATGRLRSVSGQNVSGGSYDYNALNQLTRQQVNDDDIRQLYYQQDELVTEIRRTAK